MTKKDQSGDLSRPSLPVDLPPEVALLLPTDELREAAALAYRLFSDDTFRRDFWSDPAETMVRNGIAAEAKTVLALQRIDQEVFDILVREWKEISIRSQAFKWSSDAGPARIALEALVMAATMAAAMVGAHYLAHHILHQMERDI